MNPETEELLKSCKALVEIVEGVRSERWNSDGFRLKDTKEWCDFYVKFNRSEEPQLQTT